ncbi:MAG TPA: hypothetical protein VIL32_18095 [Steroidobacteraceae bacterium]
MRNLIGLLVALFVLSGCATGYTLVSPKQVSVARGAMTVKPSVAWNKTTRGPLDIPEEEMWTQNGLLLDAITFIGAVPEGNAIARQRPRDDRKVPVFRADMTPQDLVSMVETCYRIKKNATVFETLGVAPASLAGRPAIQFDYSFVQPDEVKRRGRALIAVVGGKFYMLALEGAALHYFDAALPEFETIAASASIPGAA